MAHVLPLSGALDAEHADDHRPLGMLVGARQRVHQRGGRFRVVNARPEVADQLRLAGVWPLPAHR